MKVTTDGCLFGAWVAEEISKMPTGVAKKTALDIGAGTGLLSLMSAQRNTVVIDAIEIDKEAAQQAAENIGASAWKHSITVSNIDIALWPPTKKYDYIICNPPFYETHLKSASKNKNVAHHDDSLKLEDLLRSIEMHLAPAGFFYLLIPAPRLPDLENLLKKNYLYVHKKIAVRQTTTHTAFRFMIQGARHQLVEIQSEEISVKEAGNQYTPCFIALLKEYYLNL